MVEPGRAKNERRAAKGREKIAIRAGVGQNDEERWLRAKEMGKRIGGWGIEEKTIL